MKEGEQVRSSLDPRRYILVLESVGEMLRLCSGGQVREGKQADAG